MVARNKHVAKLWDEFWPQPEVPRRTWKMMEKLRTPPPPCSPLPPPSPPASHSPASHPPAPPTPASSPDPKESPPPTAPAPLPPDVPVISLGHSKRLPPPDVRTTELTALHPIPSLVQLSALTPAPPPAPMTLAGLQSPLLPPQYHPHPFLNSVYIGTPSSLSLFPTSRLKRRPSHFEQELMDAAAESGPPRLHQQPGALAAAERERGLRRAAPAPAHAPAGQEAEQERDPAAGHEIHPLPRAAAARPGRRRARARARARGPAAGQPGGRGPAGGRPPPHQARAGAGPGAPDAAGGRGRWGRPVMIGGPPLAPRTGFGGGDSGLGGGRAPAPRD
ncbi:protein lyl-1 isoform X2 [Dermochelys coriacea]|uniref:protein lyl-1 isoform X2 n=1 Tax=Dermochelys coriacea TaxID=27794 RepID=UPI001CA9E68B|nr:protein lyl-1 isoform X2 [Dermochelys coriacea]